MIKALEAGSIPSSLQRMVIGRLNHSRWLTTANRFLDIWTRELGLCGLAFRNLKLICQLNFGIYYKQWFAIRCYHKLTDGSRHMLKQATGAIHILGLGGFC